MLGIDVIKKFIDEQLATLQRGGVSGARNRLRTETSQKKYRPDSRQNHNKKASKTKRKMSYMSRKINRQRSKKK